MTHQYPLVYIPKRENPIVNRLNKTKVERTVDHEAERIDRTKRENAVKRAAAAAKVREPPTLLIARGHINATPILRKRQTWSLLRHARPRRPPARTTRS